VLAEEHVAAQPGQLLHKSDEARAREREREKERETGKKRYSQGQNERVM
jgi:hypothetical protein